MLPLWIIDLTENTERQTHFQRLLTHVSGVCMADKSYDESMQTDLMWYYTTYSDIGQILSEDDADEVDEDDVYSFQERLVRDGQSFVQMLRRSNVDGSLTLNVCVLGDVTEKLTQLIFPSVAVMLQKEKGRLMPNHIHQGFSVVGSLFIPADVNSKPVRVRQSVLLTLQEIEVQHNIRSVHGYDRMFIYQDVQNRTERCYQQLDAKGEAEYLVQCLIHLYYACDEIHPLISGSTSNDSFYFSLGVASCFFDTHVQDRIDNAMVVNRLLTTLSQKGDLEEVDDLNQFIQFDEFEVSEIIRYFQDVTINLSKAKVEPPNPHPIADFFSKRLKRNYYNHYLRYYPANLRLKMLETVASESDFVLEGISAERRKVQKIFSETTMPLALEKQFLSSNQHTGIITRIADNVKALKSRIGKMKESIPAHIEQEVWMHLQQQNVPKRLRDDFEEYHESYRVDNQKQGKSQQCEEMKKSAQEDLMNHIKQEPTFLGRMSRAFLMGIVLVLGAMPVLDFLSPQFVDLGNVKTNALYWSAGLFMLPLLGQFISLYLYNRKKKNKERRMMAYYLHDAYERIANRIHSETELLYDNLMTLCDEYGKRCDLVQKEVRPFQLGDLYEQTGLPTTQFNQPVVGGRFSGKQIIPEEEDECREIYVNRGPRKINDLDEDDVHQLLHTYKDDVLNLFSHIEIPEKHPRRFDEEKGFSVFVSKAEREREREQVWENGKDALYRSLQALVNKDFLPRLYTTIDEKVCAYVRKKQCNDLMRPFFLFAATNGELTSSADVEIMDVKCNNERMRSLFEAYMPDSSTQYQVDSYKEIYGKFLFLTRWRTFEKISLNRILPAEDFDVSVRARLVNEEEQAFCRNSISSLILWSMCRDDKSTEWMSLFDADKLTENIEKRDAISRKLNTKD